MKTRSGFVSNSSSSSFVILGRRLELEELQKEWADDIWMHGNYVGEGHDIFKLTPEMIDLLVKHNIHNHDFFKAHAVCYTEGGSEMIKTAEMPSYFFVWSFEKSYHSTESLKIFKERYIERED